MFYLFQDFIVGAQDASSRPEKWICVLMLIAVWIGRFLLVSGASDAVSIWLRISWDGLSFGSRWKESLFCSFQRLRVNLILFILDRLLLHFYLPRLPRLLYVWRGISAPILELEPGAQREDDDHQQLNLLLHQSQFILYYTYRWDQIEWFFIRWRFEELSLKQTIRSKEGRPQLAGLSWRKTGIDKRGVDHWPYLLAWRHEEVLYFMFLSLVFAEGKTHLHVLILTIRRLPLALPSPLALSELWDR